MKRGMNGVVAQLFTTAGMGLRNLAPPAARIQPQKVVLAPECAGAPIASFYASASAATVVDVPLHRCRGLWFAGFSCAAGSDHPFVRTMSAYETGVASSYAGSPLEEFYESWRPASAAESLGLHETSGLFARVPALAAVAPWWPVHDLTAFAVSVSAMIEADNRERGSALRAEAGSHLHGPVSLAKGELEFDRCVEIYQAIRTFGYHRSSDTANGDVRGQVLVREDGDYAIMVLHGQHRIAAAAAAGLPAVPVRFHHGSSTGSRVIHRADVDQWPSVRRGWLSVPEALHVFDRLFEGRQAWTPAASLHHGSGETSERPVRA